jgi:hypothetical protein
MTSRIDIHRPSAIIPADYTFVTVNYRDADGLMDPYAVQVFNAHRKGTGGVFSDHAHKGGCMVCGAWMIDHAIFYHAPTNAYVKTGCDCAEHIEHGHADAFKQSAKIRRKKAKMNKEVAECSEKLSELGLLEQVEMYFEPNDIGGAISGCREKHETNLLGCHLFGTTDQEFRQFAQSFAILTDLVHKLRKWGLSEKQVTFLKSLCEKFVDLPRTITINREKDAARADAPEGKVVVRGTVLTVKDVEGYYGYEYKMLIEHETGYKVWVTVPKKISDVVRGNVVEMTMNLTISNKDPKFAYGKRPSKPQIIEIK